MGGVPRGLSQQLSQADAARKWNVDVSTVITDPAAGQGRGAGRVRRLEAGAVALARAGGVGGRAGGERSALGGAEGAGGRAELAPGKATLGLFGPVPRRVSAGTKLELMGLVDGAVAAGWAHVRACRVLQIEDVRVHRWRARLAETGSLDDRPSIGDAVHRILDWEEQAILDLIEEWGPATARTGSSRTAAPTPAGVRFALDAVAGRAQAPRRVARRAVPPTTAKAPIS